MNEKKILISVISPVYLAEDLIDMLVQRLRISLAEITGDYEIILVDDGSTDHTEEKIKYAAAMDSKITGIFLAENYGQHPAIKAGIDHASGEWIVVMDCDLQDEPEEIPLMYKKTAEGYDCIFAWRNKKNDPFLKRTWSFLFYTVLSVLTGIRMNGHIANFGLYRRDLIQRMQLLPAGFFFFPLSVRKAKPVQATYVKVHHAARAAGKTTYSFGKSFRLAMHVFRGVQKKQQGEIYSVKEIISAS